MALFGIRGSKDIKPKPEEINTEGNLINLVNDEFKRRQQERMPFELIWRLCIAFIEGNQYLDINPAVQTLEEVPKLFWWQEREVFNQIGAITETRIAKLSRMRPILKTRPGTDAQEDIRSAKVGSQLLKNIYNDQGIRNLMGEVYAWMEATGSCLFKHIWNPNKGEIIGKAVITNDETGETTEEELREGDLDVIVVPSQEIYPDSNYRQDVENCRSIIHAKAYHVDEIEETWGVKVEPEDTTAMQLQTSMVGVGGLGYGMGGFRYSTTRLKDHAVVKEYWERPTRKFPEGRLIIVAGGKLLYFGPLPYPVGEDEKPALPFTKVDCIERPGVFWGRSVVERLIPIQRRYNALRNRKAEYLNRAAIGQWSVEDGAVDMEIFESEAGAPGAIHVYKKSGSPPQLVQTPPLPAAFETEEQSLLQEFTALSGVSDLSRQSKAPPGVKSGVALSIALEQDDTRLSATASNIEQFLIKSGKIWLRLYKTFVKGVRTLRAIGENNVVEVLDWTAADIRSDDVVIESFSALAESPAQRRQMVFDLLNAGLFNDPETGRITKEGRAKILEMIEMGNWETADDDDQLHVAKAERENRQMAQGGAPQAVNYDDHVLHISRHNKFRLTTDYEQMLAQNPAIDQIFQAHVNMHLAYLAPQQEEAGNQFMPGRMPTYHDMNAGGGGMDATQAG